MGEVGGRSRLTSEALTHDGIDGLGGNELDGDPPVEPIVVALDDVGHAASTDGVAEPVAAGDHLHHHMAGAAPPNPIAVRLAGARSAGMTSLRSLMRLDATTARRAGHRARRLQLPPPHVVPSRGVIRLRQVALVAADRDAVVADLCTFLGVSVCFEDPGVAVFGLHNALMTIGDQFLEVVSPTTEGTTAGRLIDKRGGDGGYMAIFEVDDLDRRVEHVTELGVRIVWSGDFPEIRGRHLHPRDVGGAIVSLDQPEPHRLVVVGRAMASPRRDRRRHRHRRCRRRLRGS